jgi:small-conductance mechanosensitive channel
MACTRKHLPQAINLLDLPLFPLVWNQIIFGNPISIWLTSLALFLCVVVIGKLLFRVGLKYLKNLADVTAWQADDILLEVLKANSTLLLVGWGIFAGLQVLQVPDRIQNNTENLMLVLLIFQAGLWVHKGLEVWLQWRFVQTDSVEQGDRVMTLSLLSFLGKLLLWAIVVLLALDNLGLNITALVASLGIGGVAVALAVQNILGDLFASLSISIDKPFVIGDFVMVDNLMGTVEHVGLKTTRLRSLDGEQIVFANTDLLRSRVRNFKRMNQRRCAFSFGVTYTTPADQLAYIPAKVEAIIKSQSQVRFGRAHFKSFGESSLDFEVVYFVLNPDYDLYMDVQQAINLSLVRHFEQQGIDFAMPTRTLHVHTK